MPVSSTFPLGRGRSPLEVSGGRVIKTAPRWELAYMRRHPEVFVPILGWNSAVGDTIRYAMPLCAPGHPDHLEEALVAGATKLKNHLWTRSDVSRCWYVSLREHLHHQVAIHHLEVDLKRLDIILRAVKPSTDVQAIHGDATLANMVRDTQGWWWWIDPLNRLYIPGDPHVDLGKMFQSCLGYERVLLGLPRVEETDLMKVLARGCRLSYELGRLWCYIHIVRLLPYQTPDVRATFEGVLKEWR